MADECAGVGCALDDSPLYSSPQKYVTLHLRLQPSLHNLVERERLCATLPREGAPGKSILKQVVSVKTKRAVNLRNTILVRDVVHRPVIVIVARVVAKRIDSEVQC